MPLKTTTKAHSITIITFKDHVYEIFLSKKRDKKTIPIDEEENKVIRYLLKMQNEGFPLYMG